MTIQFWSKFIFVFGILQFVARVHCKGLGEPSSTNDLDLAFGNVLTSTLEKQTKATEEMFEIKMADHRDELNDMLDSKQEKQRHQITDVQFRVQVLDAKLIKMDKKLDQQKDGFVQVLDDKMDQQKDEFVQMLEKQKEVFVQLLQTALQHQKETFEQNLEDQKETYEQNLEDQIENITKSLEENHGMVLYSLATTFIADNVRSTKSCSCPTNWNKVLDTHILLSSESADFDTAIEKCKDLGGKLYEPQSLFHNQLVSALIEAEGIQSSGFWIGIHDKFTEGSFVYQSNNRSIAFQHWGSFNNGHGSQPNNFNGDQNCVFMHGTTYSGPKGSWNDLKCSESWRFICEKETL